MDSWKRNKIIGEGSLFYLLLIKEWLERKFDEIKTYLRIYEWIPRRKLSRVFNQLYICTEVIVTALSTIQFFHFMGISIVRYKFCIAIGTLPALNDYMKIIMTKISNRIILRSLCLENQQEAKKSLATCVPDVSFSNVLKGISGKLVKVTKTQAI